MSWLGILRSTVILAIALGLLADDRPRLRPLPALDQNLKTGPTVGKRIPRFEARDHTGKLQTLETLRGRKGLVLLFFRSADW